MATPPVPAASTTRGLEIHLAFEVDWLVYAAVSFRDIRNKDAVIFQNSVFLNARNLLEFTKPYQPRNGWWICQFAGATPTTSTEFENWNEFINANVTHLGERRLATLPWPIQERAERRLIILAHFCLDRIASFAPDVANPNGEVMGRVVTLGRTYLDEGDNGALDALDALTVR